MPTVALLGTFRIDGPDPLHRAIRDARAGHLQANSGLLDAVGRATTTVWPEITAGLVVPVPGHRAGAAPPIVRETARVIAGERGWGLAPYGLRRVRDVPEAKVGGPRDEALEVETLVWRHDGHGEVIVLVDDVLRTGATLRACAAAIRQAGDQRRVVALVVARAWSMSAGPGRRHGAHQDPVSVPASAGCRRD